MTVSNVYLSFRHLVWATVCILILTSCGGGGGGGSAPPPPVNQAPTAAAGADQSVDEGTTVTLTGSGTDDGTIDSFQWQQIGGTAVDLNNANTATATFTTPNIEISTTLTFQLMVTDNAGLSATASVNIQVNPRADNSRAVLGPIVDARVDASLVTDLTTVIETTTTLNSGNLNEAGTFILNLNGVDDAAFVLVTITGGEDIDVDDNGIIDQTPTPNEGTFRGLATAADWRAGGHVTALTEILVRELIGADPEQLETMPAAEIEQLLTETAQRLLNDNADVNEDGRTDFRDLLDFLPTDDDFPLDVPLAEVNEIGSSIVTGEEDSRIDETITDLLNLPPQVNAGDDQTVDEGTAVTLNGSGSDDGVIVSYAWSQISGDAVALTNTGSATATFTAPTLSTETTLTFQLSVTDDLGESATDTVSVTVQPVNASPHADAGDNQIVNELTLVNLNGSRSSDSDGSIVSFQWIQTSGPAVNLINPASATPQFTAPDIEATTDLDFQLTVRDNEGANNSSSVTVTISPVSSGGFVTIQGRATYDRVPLEMDGLSARLDFDNIIVQPMRGISVELLDDTGQVLVGTVTDDQGNYAFDVAENTDVRVQIKAELVSAGTPGWDVAVVDNTSSDAQYVLVGNLSSSGTSASVRDLHAPSGWDGLAYAETRAAAPFAILDSIYDALQKTLVVDPGVILSPVAVEWSINNEDGTYYHPFDKIIRLNGKANTDTDEYDVPVVLHEWGHHVIRDLSRSDSIGGPHALTDSLDMRVAYDEGLASALYAIFTDNPMYGDTAENLGEGRGWSWDIENNDRVANKGWYNEVSIAAIVYDLYDSVDEPGIDTLSLDFAPIYSALTNHIIDTPALTSIFPFIRVIREQQSDDVAAIDTLVSYHQTVSATIDDYGSTETNNDSLAHVLPVYTTIAPDGNPVNVCTITNNRSIDDFPNALSNSRFLRFVIDSTNVYNIVVETTQSAGLADPSFGIYDHGALIVVEDTSFTDTESWSDTLNSGTYVMEVRDSAFMDTACFDIRINLD